MLMDVVLMDEIESLKIFRLKSIYADLTDTALMQNDVNFGLPRLFKAESRDMVCFSSPKTDGQHIKKSPSLTKS
jgi:hypothetical protein